VPLQFRSEPSWAPETLVPRTGLTSASSLVLAPNDFNDVAEVAQTLNVFERHYDEIAQPFAWSFTREKLAELLERLDTDSPQVQPAQLAA
jgi:hypothetical protein